MCSKVKQTQSHEKFKLEKKIEQAYKKICNISKKVNTLLRDRERFLSPGFSTSISNETTVDWRVKLEMDEKVGLTLVQSQTDSKYQIAYSLNSPSGQSMNGYKK